MSDDDDVFAEGNETVNRTIVNVTDTGSVHIGNNVVNNYIKVFIPPSECDRFNFDPISARKELEKVEEIKAGYNRLHLTDRQISDSGDSINTKSTSSDINSPNIPWSPNESRDRDNRVPEDLGFRVSSSEEDELPWKEFLRVVNLLSSSPLTNLQDRIGSTAYGPDIFRAILNRSMDFYLERVKRLLVDRGDCAVGFEEICLVAPFEFCEWVDDASLRINEGVVWDLSKLARRGDVVANMPDSENINIRIEFAIFEIDFIANYSWPSDAIGKYKDGLISVSFPSCGVVLDLQIDASGKPKFKDLSVDLESKLYIRYLNIWGLPFFNVMQDCSDRIAPKFREAITTKIRDRLKTTFQDQLNSLIDPSAKEQYQSGLPNSPTMEGSWEELLSTLKSLSNEELSTQVERVRYFGSGPNTFNSTLIESMDIFLRRVKGKLRDICQNGVQCDSTDMVVRTNEGYASLKINGGLIENLGELSRFGLPMAAVTPSSNTLLHLRLKLEPMNVKAKYTLRINERSEDGQLIASVPDSFVRVFLRVDRSGPPCLLQVVVPPEIRVELKFNCDSHKLFDCVVNSEDLLRLSNKFWEMSRKKIEQNLAAVFLKQLKRFNGKG